uniref:Nucleolus and neural progenitor protein-like N-terminal domain-containing protein n=1 Tax=Panagrolaimus superbus TaxID=310955 RepID=A0A914YYW8_9BILA
MSSSLSPPSTSFSAMNSDNVLDFVTSFSSSPAQSYFHRKSVIDPKIREKLNLFRLQLNQIFTKLKQEKCDSLILPLHQKRYKDITYKHGLSQKHQKFWKATQQLIKQQKKINEINYLDGFRKIAEGLTKSTSSYEYTKEGIVFAGVQLIQRILHLDKLRILCIRAINLYMGYIELGHYLIFLLMLVAMAAELSTEANRQILILHGIYDSLGKILHSIDQKFPLNSKLLPYESKQTKSNEITKEVELILKLVNAPAWDEAKIVQKYREEMGLQNAFDGGDAIQEIDEETKKQMEEATSMTQQLLLLSRKRKSENDESQGIFERKKQKNFKKNQKR